MAASSATDVPPNFSTRIGSPSQCRRREDSLRDQQFGVQHRRARRAAYRVVAERHALQPEQRALPDASHRDRHAAIAVHVEPWLRSIGRGRDDDR